MFLYFHKRFDSSLGGKSIETVAYDNCQKTYHYELARIGEGSAIAPYWIGSGAAANRAERKAQKDLDRRLASESELVPCPHCNWISEQLIQNYRLGRYRGVGKIAFALGLLGSLLCCVVALIIYDGPQQDHWLLPYILIGGLAGSIGIAWMIIGIRNWFRNRIQPNSQFPEIPVLPPGTPPALLLDEETQTLRPAKPTTMPAEDILEFQYARNALPDVCCTCLQPGTTGQGYPIAVTPKLQFLLPCCTTCAREATWKRRRILFKSFLWGLAISGISAFLMDQANQPMWVIIDVAVILVVMIVILTSLFTSSINSPGRIVGSDPDRGVVRIQFNNANYVAIVNAFLNQSSEDEE